MEDMNSLARTTTVASRTPIVTKHMAMVVTPPSEPDLHSQNLHVEDGPVFRFDSKVGPSEPRGNYRSYLDMQQMEADAQRMTQPPRPLPQCQGKPQTP